MKEYGRMLVRRTKLSRPVSYFGRYHVKKKFVMINDEPAILPNLLMSKSK